MTILNGNSTAPWLYTIGTTGRVFGIDGYSYQVIAWDLRQAIRETRKIVSRQWALRFVKKERI